MNPLSKVRPDWEKIGIQHSSEIALKKRPQLSIIISQCVGVSAEIDVWMGLVLATISKANAEAAVAMYNSVQSRSAQIAMFRAAADASIGDPDQRQLLEAVLRALVVPAYKERDRLAHWTWAVSDALPDDLLLVEPMAQQAFLLSLQNRRPLKLARDHIYVVTKPNLESVLDRVGRAKRVIGRFTGLFWIDEQEYASQLRSLSNEPDIRPALDRIRLERKSAPEAQQ